MIQKIKDFCVKYNLLYKAVSLALALFLWLTITTPFK
jgi:hypothetical protein